MRNSAVRRILFVFIWLAIWQAASLLVHNNILLAGPYETILALLRLGKTSEFWISVLFTVLKIASGFLIGSSLGIFLAALSYRFRAFREFVNAPVSVIKSVPVASFVILVIIWSKAAFLSVVISALVVFPIVYLNVLAGLDSADRKLIETGRIFRFRFRDKIRHIYLPAVSSHLESAVSSSSGMAFKSGIAAEVIGRPAYSIGNGIYLSKITLLTSDLLAWTFCAVILAFLFEKAVSALLRRILPE